MTSLEWTLVITFDDGDVPTEATRVRDRLLRRMRAEGHPEARSVTVESWLFRDQLKPPEPRVPVARSPFEVRSRRRPSQQQQDQP